MDRLLNAPDVSNLQVLHHGAVIGTLSWKPFVTEVGAPTDDAAVVLEGMVVSAGYSVDAELTINAELPTDRWRVLSHLELDTNKVWQEWTIRVQQRPAIWELVARQGEDDVVLRFEEGKERWEKRFSLRDLANPRSVLGPYALLLPGPLVRHLGQLDAPAAERSFKWRATHDWLRVGRNRVRVYRLSASLFANYELVVYLSRAGEVLKVQLPDTFMLLNEALPGLRKEGAGKND